MFSAILINTLIIALVVSVHYEVLHTLFVWVPKMPIPNRFRVVVAIFGVLIAHTIEIWIFAASYYWLLQVGWHGSLERNFDGLVIRLAPRLVANSVSFKLCGKLLTLDMKLKAETGTTESMSLQSYLRKLE